MKSSTGAIVREGGSVSNWQIYSCLHCKSPRENSVFWPKAQSWRWWAPLQTDMTKAWCVPWAAAGLSCALQDCADVKPEGEYRRKTGTEGSYFHGSNSTAL